MMSLPEMRITPPPSYADSNNCIEVLLYAPIVVSNAYEYESIHSRLADVGYRIRDEWVKDFTRNGRMRNILMLSDCVMSGIKRSRPQNWSEVECPPKKLICIG